MNMNNDDDKYKDDALKNDAQKPEQNDEQGIVPAKKDSDIKMRFLEALFWQVRQGLARLKAV